MATHGGMNLFNEGLVFAYDTGAERCYNYPTNMLNDIVGTFDNPPGGILEVDDVLYSSGGMNNSWPASLNSDDNTTPRSWEVVVNPQISVDATMGIFGHQSLVGHIYFSAGGLFVVSGIYKFTWYDGTTYQYLSSGVVPQIGVPAHIVGTYDTGDRKPRIYINGELKATYSVLTSMDYSSGMSYVSLGEHYYTTPDRFFRGYIPVARYYKGTALSLEQVQQNYNNYKNRFDI